MQSKNPQDPERIWLQNADDAKVIGDRLWCEDKVWPECDEQNEPTEYVRSDLIESLRSRAEKAEAELRTMTKRFNGAVGLKDQQRMRAEIAEATCEKLAAALEPFAKPAAQYDPEEGDDNLDAWAHSFKIGHLRNARSALDAYRKEASNAD